MKENGCTQVIATPSMDCYKNDLQHGINREMQEKRLSTIIWVLIEIWSFKRNKIVLNANKKAYTNSSWG